MSVNATGKAPPALFAARARERETVFAVAVIWFLSALITAASYRWGAKAVVAFEGYGGIANIGASGMLLFAAWLALDGLRDARDRLRLQILSKAGSKLQTTLRASDGKF